MTEELINLLFSGVVISVIFTVTIYSWWSIEGREKFLRQQYPNGSTIYLKNNFPIKKLRGIELLVNHEWSNHGGFKIRTRNTDKDSYKQLMSYQNELNSLSYDTSISFYGYSSVDECVLTLPDKYVTNEKEEEKIVKKRKGHKMPIAHRWAINTAIVFLVWKFVLNIESIIKYIIGLL